MHLAQRLLLAATLIMAGRAATAQTATPWHGKQCAVVLTYDDAIDADLDRVVPALDSLGLRGTFYLTDVTHSVGEVADTWL